MEADMTEENIEQANTDFETSEKPQEQDSSEITDEESLDQTEDDEIIESTDSIELTEDAETKEDTELTEVVEQAGDTEPEEFEEDFEITAESVVEAVLFASDESLTAARLADIVETGAKQIREHVENLNQKYATNGNAFRIDQIAGGYQMMTLPPYNHWLKKLLRVRSDNKLSPAALETLAIIAYKQPIIRADIEAIRGVAAGEMIRNLMYKGLVKIVGRAEVLGRPMLYGTTKKFLEVFGLNTLKDLPKVEELKKPPT
jgi:segregation and condensation protein B